MAIKKTILITGASSGIGAELAKGYASTGVTLLLTGRNAERTEAVAAACRDKGADVETCTTCVTEKDAFAAQVATWDDAHPIDLVIANAGISGGLDKEDDSLFRTIMAINLDGTLNTVFPLIPRMKKRKSGHIVLMSSMAGFRGMPNAPAYSVSKNAVRALGEALRPLLAKEGVNVSTICPGFIRTPLTDVNTFKMPFLMDVVDAADIIISGIEKNKAVIALPFRMRMLVMFLAAFPRCLGDWILSKAPNKP